MKIWALQFGLSIAAIVGIVGACAAFVKPPAAACVARGPLPDPVCTPGAVEPLTREQICTEPTSHRRRVSERTKRAVFLFYGVPWAERGRYEVDHRVPLCAGGSNEETNLWPEPSPGFGEKDVVEARVCADLCSGRITLEEAQRVFLGDWRDAQ